jgi:tight adherence protein B
VSGQAGLALLAPPWLALVVGLAVAVGALRALVWAPRRALVRRLQALSAPVGLGMGGGDGAAGGAGASAAGRRARRSRLRSHGAAGAGVALVLERAGWALTPGEFLALRAGAGAVGAAFGLAVAGAPGALVVAALGIALPALAANRRGEARMRTLEGQVADALVLMAAALNAGYGLGQALRAAARETAPPLGPYLGEALRRAELGVPLEETLLELARRLDQTDLALVGHAVAVERQVGGSLAEILDQIAATVRERIQLRQRLRAATAQNRLSATILTLLPVGVGLMLVATARSFVSVLWTTTPGLGMLGAIVVLDAIGIAWVRRVGRIDV